MIILRGARSFVSVLLVGLWFVANSPVLRLLVVPACWLVPHRRHWLGGRFMKRMSIGIWACLRLGGARVRRHGRIPTARAGLRGREPPVPHRHLQITLMSTPLVPGFVTRTRYQRWIPLVSTSARLVGSPFVDPRRDPTGAVAAIERAARELPNGVAIFPEGHRSRDG